ncbi:MAG: pectate lyase precursor [Nannocystaceae bacterium]|nr:pectate lyase precursor [Nannocystaceae bacterium]
MASGARTMSPAVFVIAASLILFTSTEASALPAFPGAEGIAGAITGGRGGQVIKVTTLAASGPGSLQAALDVDAPRVIVFDVSGVIEADEVIIPHGNVTIAGESAPGAGITIDGRLLAEYEYGIDNIIIRHVRVRPTAPMGPGEQFDAIALSRCSGVLLDHVSASFAIDETVDLYEAQDVTVQWSSIESSATSGHPEGIHNYGLIQGPDGARASILNNLFAHHRNRSPALATGPSEVRGNVAYNVRHGFVHHNPAAGAFAITNNNYLAGPDDDLIPLFFDDETQGSDPGLQYFLEDNYIDDPGVFTGVFDNPWAMPWSHPSFEDLRLPESYRASEEPDWATLVPDRVPVAQRAASEALAAVLSCAGAWPRDVVSIRSVAETEARSGSWGARVPADLMEGLVPAEAPEDQDGDGMPDAWERAAGLDPDDAADATTVQDSGYTAIEAYLHERAAALVPQGCPSGAETDPGPGTGSGSSSDGGDSGSLTSGGTDTPQASTGVAPTSSGTTDTDGSTGPTAETTDGGGCSCRSQHPAPATWLLLCLVSLVRRRDARAAEC